MNPLANPAQTAFLAALRNEFLFCQVVIRRDADGFILRHVADTSAPAESLRSIRLSDARALAQTTASGAFRPLKSAPNLPSGWQLELRQENILFDTLSMLYPGAVADWFAAQSQHPPVTNYREFTARQTGMYRITASLGSAPARAAFSACCHEDFCLKRRLWTLEGLSPDDAAARKSVIPCLEPCAIMLEFARKVARWEQGIDAPETHAPEPVGAASEPPAECDFDAPANARRLRFVLEKRRRAVTSPP
jgi:hypothetical protein